MPWVEQRNADLPIAKGTAIELTYIGGMIGASTYEQLVDMASNADSIHSYLAERVKKEVSDRGKMTASAFNYDDDKERYVVQGVARVNTTLRMVRQPETLNVDLPADQPAGPLQFQFSLQRTRINVGQYKSDALDPIAAGAATLAGAEAKVVNAAKNVVSAVRNTAESAGHAIGGLINALPVIGIIVGIGVIVWLKRRGG